MIKLNRNDRLDKPADINENQKQPIEAEKRPFKMNAVNDYKHAESINRDREEGGNMKI